MSVPTGTQGSNEAPINRKNRMTPDQIRQLIKSLQPDTGKSPIFEIVFRRRTDKKVNGVVVAKAGDLRTLRGRLGMQYGIERNDDGSKHVVRVNGKGQPYEAKAYNLLTVREANGSFRNVPMDSVVSLRVPDNSKHLVGVAV